MNKLEELTNDYAKLMKKQDALDELKAEVKEKMMVAMAKAGTNTFGNDKGKFTVSALKKWTYSKKVEVLEAEVKTLKTKEQDNGTATAVVTDSIKFTPSK